MTRHRKPTRKSSDALPVADILASVGKTLNLDQKVQEWAVLSLWERVIDPCFQTQTRAARVRRVRNQNELVIQVASATVAAELTFSLETYRERLNVFAPQTGLTIHRLKVVQAHFKGHG